MGFFSKFKGKGSGGDVTPKKSKNAAQANGAVSAPPPKPRWDDAWMRKQVEPEEVQELLRGCTVELKSRGMPDCEMDNIYSGRLMTKNQRWKCPSSSSPSDRRPTPALPGRLYGTISASGDHIWWESAWSKSYYSRSPW